jgi:hypothetical protein
VSDVDEDTVCPLCRDVGWLLDANGAGMNEPLSLELIVCIHPECRASGMALAQLSFREPVFRHASISPNHGFVMSVSS